MVGEARTMDYARRHGYPVPAVEEISADGTDLVMERIDGPSMV
jgi:tRNA A-37 threonylcarbamoyl transferase component Bud32